MKSLYLTQFIKDKTFDPFPSLLAFCCFFPVEVCVYKYFGFKCQPHSPNLFKGSAQINLKLQEEHLFNSPSMAHDLYYRGFPP